MLPNYSKKYIRMVFFIGVMALLGAYVWSERQLVSDAIHKLTGRSLVLISTTLFLQWGLRAKSDQLIYQASGHKLNLRKIWQYNNNQLVLNYLPMKAGTVSLAYHLKKNHGITLGDFLSIFAVQNLLSVLVTSVIALVCLFYVQFDPTFGPILITTLFCLFLLSVWLLFFGQKFASIFKVLGNRVHSIAKGLAVFRQHHRLGMWVIVMGLFGYSIAAWRLQLIYELVGIHSSFLQVMIISAAIQISMIISFTPAGIGIREALVGLMSIALTFDGSFGVITASIERVIVLFWVILLFVLFKIASIGRQNAEQT